MDLSKIIVFSPVRFGVCFWLFVLILANRGRHTITISIFSILCNHSTRDLMDSVCLYVISIVKMWCIKPVLSDKTNCVVLDPALEVKVLLVGQLGLMLILNLFIA